MSEREKHTFIYALLEPGGSLDNPASVRYIGKTNHPRVRFRRHINRARRGDSHLRKHRWIRSLLKRGEKPSFVIIERCSCLSWEDREQHYIARFRELGADLTNLTDGGDGVSSDLMTAMWQDPDSTYNDPKFRKKQSVQNVKRWQDPEYKRRLKKALRQAGKREDARRNRSISARRRFAKMSKEERREATAHLDKFAGATLTEEQVIAIREEYASGISATELADKYNVVPHTIYGITNGRSWTHVGGPISSKKRGGNHPDAKLTEEDVIEMRRIHDAGGTTIQRLSELFGMSHSQTRRIVRRESWKHVE